MSARRTHAVFISYSHESAMHDARVLAFANRLRDHGVDAWIDRYESAPREGWPRWMQRQIRDAEFILIVCTATYRDRFEAIDDLDPNSGLGVTFEGLLATQLIYEERENRRCVPVLFEDTPVDTVPLLLRPYSRYRLPSGFDDLYRLLTKQPAIPPPALGPLRRLRAIWRVRSPGMPVIDIELAATIAQMKLDLEFLMSELKAGRSVPSRIVTPTMEEIERFNPVFQRIMRQVRNSLPQLATFLQATLLGLIDRLLGRSRDK